MDRSAQNSFFIFILFFISFQSIATQAPLVLVQTHLGGNFQCAQNTLKKAYQTIGIDISFLTLPAKRALKMANDGDADGEMLRVKGIEVEFTNLIPIPVRLCSVESVLIANNKVTANNFKDLRKYRFGIVAGFVHQENKVKEFQLDAVRVNKNKKLLELMLLDRVDAIFLSKKASAEFLNNDQQKEFKILKFFSRKIYLYHYLHKKNQDIVPLITKELKIMESNGLIDLQAHHL